MPLIIVLELLLLSVLLAVNYSYKRGRASFLMFAGVIAITLHFLYDFIVAHLILSKKIPQLFYEDWYLLVFRTFLLIGIVIGLIGFSIYFKEEKNR